MGAVRPVVLVKIATFFLIGMVVLAMFGRLRWPGGARRLGDKARKLRGERPPKPTKCRHCGSYIVGPGPCPCGRKG